MWKRRANDPQPWDPDFSRKRPEIVAEIERRRREQEQQRAADAISAADEIESTD